MRGSFFLPMALAWAVASAAGAQTPAETAAAAEPPTPSVATTPAAPAAAQPATPARDAPIAFVVLREARVPDGVFSAMQTAGLEALRPLIRGRALDALDGAGLAACADDGCLGAELARAGKAGGVIVRLSRRGQGPVEIRATANEAGSGMQRGEAITGSIAGAELARPSNAVAAFVARLQPVLWPQPAPMPTLLVAVNVDGASVTVDGNAAGTSPLAPVQTTPGRHVVSVSLSGYEGTSRTAEAGETGTTRVDLDLTPTPEMAQRLAARHAAAGALTPEEEEEIATAKPWYERWYVWAGVGAVVVTAVVIGAVVGTSEDTINAPAGAVGIPPIR